MLLFDISFNINIFLIFYNMSPFLSSGLIYCKDCPEAKL